ncbi:MAG: HAMP domain-containing protein [Anaerolineae bacterium]|nr:HAMP domain-containing protein [Anaerolineae bacterium]
MKLRSISLKVFIPLAVLLLLGAAAIILNNVVSANHLLGMEEEKRLLSYAHEFQALIDERGQMAAAMAASVAGLPEVQRAFAKQDRDTLLQIMLPSYQKIADVYGVSQAQFHLPPATSFLRLHKPEKFGDDLTSFRKTVVVANSRRETASGLEVGVGGVGIRGVTPVFFEEKHIGSFEYGMNFDQKFLGEYKQIVGADVAVYLQKTVVDPAAASAGGAETETGKSAAGLTLYASTVQDPPLVAEDVRQQVFAEGVERISYVNVGRNSFAVVTTPILDYQREVIGLAEIFVPRDETLALIARSRNLNLLFILAVLIGILPLIYVILQRVVVRPLRVAMALAQQVAETDLQALSQQMERMAGGDWSGGFTLSAQPIAGAAEDEVGALARALNQMIAALQEMGTAFDRMKETLRSVLRQVAGNATALKDFSRNLADAMEQSGHAVGDIVEVVQQLAQSAFEQGEVMSHTVDAMGEMERAIDGVARGAQEQAQSVGRVAESATQIGKAIEQVEESVRAVEQGALSTAQNARRGAQAVLQTVESMQSIQRQVDVLAQRVEEMGQRSGQIVGVVELINDISSQTNLLALNAAIEAARAGEAGKGFAVVADEVRKLAERASNATGEIANLVKEIQNSVDEALAAMREGSQGVVVGVEKARDSGQMLDQILQSAEAVSAQLRQVSAAVRQINTASAEMGSAMESVSAVVEQNTAATEEMSAGSKEVSESLARAAQVSARNAQSIESVSAATEELNAQAEELMALSRTMDEMAQHLIESVQRFRLT